MNYLRVGRIHFDDDVAFGYYSGILFRWKLIKVKKGYISGL